MSERFMGGGESYFEWKSRKEQDPNIEIKEHYDEIQKLLRKLVEAGGDLPIQIKKGLRQQIQSHLAALGMSDLTQLAQVYQHLHEAAMHPPQPAPAREKEANKDVIKKILKGDDYMLEEVVTYIVCNAPHLIEEINKRRYDR